MFGVCGQTWHFAVLNQLGEAFPFVLGGVYLFIRENCSNTINVLIPTCSLLC